MREKLIEILRVPIYPHELSDPTEVVADYLLDNDVVPVVHCKDCKWYKESKLMPPIKFCFRLIGKDGNHVGYNFSDDDFCSRGERRTDEVN